MNLVTVTPKRFVPFFVVILFLLVLSLSESLRTHSVQPFIDNIGVRLLSADQDNRLLTNKALAGPIPESFFARFPVFFKLSLIGNVLLNLWFLFEVFSLLSWGIRFLYSIPGELASFPTTIMAIFILILLNVIVVLYQGEQGFASWIPFSGTYYAFLNIDAFLWGA